VGKLDLLECGPRREKVSRFTTTSRSILSLRRVKSLRRSARKTP
jgi:hypothetical protein